MSAFILNQATLRNYGRQGAAHLPPIKVSHERRANEKGSIWDEDQLPLAPFNLVSPFELALLAVMLSNGKDDPANNLPAATYLWAEAFEYSEFLQDCFWGSENRVKVPGWKVISLGQRELCMDLNSACAKYVSTCEIC